MESLSFSQPCKNYGSLSKHTLLDICIYTWLETKLILSTNDIELYCLSKYALLLVVRTNTVIEGEPRALYFVYLTFASRRELHVFTH